MAEYGIFPGKDGLQLYQMAEIPSNIIMAEEFAEHIDGFSIGSNDITQLSLGLDRDSSLVAHLYDERHPAGEKNVVASYSNSQSMWDKNWYLWSWAIRSSRLCPVSGAGGN